MQKFVSFGQKKNGICLAKIQTPDAGRRKSALKIAKQKINVSAAQYIT